MTFTIGENVGPYRITDRLGQGGMASVFRAYHANLDRYVAIKILHAAFKEDPNFLARFQREAQIVARLEHPSIVPIYDFNEHNGEPYLAMKFIEGETLKARLGHQPLTLEETLKIMTAVGQALTYAHEQGVLHRDVKPSNILLEKGTTPYLADFGLARMASAGESTMSQDMMLGTPQYMSPEQAQGVKDLDGATDVYSLGVVLYELVVGRVPFNADTPYAIVHDHIYGSLPIPSQVNPQVPYAVERVLLKALAKDRYDRYGSPSQMVDAFREAVRESDLKELSASSYRVPTNAPPISAAPAYSVANPGVPVSTPPPTVGIPTPLSTVSQPQGTIGTPTGSSISRLYESQQRRKNLWMLFGFALLSLTCLAGMFIALSTYNAANEAGLFAPARVAAAGTPSTEQATVAATSTTKPTNQPTVLAAIATADGLSTNAPTQEPTSGATSAATIDATEEATLDLPAGTEQANQIIPIVPVTDAEKVVAANPNDPRAHLLLASALNHEGKLVRAGLELQNALRLSRDNADVSMQLGRSVPRGTSVSGPTMALFFAQAYGTGASLNPTIRINVGFWLYRYTQGLRKRDTISVSGLAGLIQSFRSAPLFAFLALAEHNVGLDAEASKAMDQAVTLDANAPEVHLVRGILYAAQNDTENARKEFTLAAQSTDAPNWLTTEAKKLSKGT